MIPGFTTCTVTATWLWEYKKPKLRPSTFDSYEMLIRCHLKPALGHMPLRDLRPEHLQHVYNEEMQQGASARTVRYCHILLHGALAHAEKHQLVARNVSKLTERPRAVRKEMHTLTLDQVAAQLLPAIAQDRLFAAIFLGFGTGLRRLMHILCPIRSGWQRQNPDVPRAD